MHPWIDRRWYMPVAVMIVMLGGVGFTSSALAAGSMRARGSYRSAPNKIGHSTSTNWSGYAVSGSRYTSVSASWTQPAVDCSLTPTGWSAFWVGLDGDISDTVSKPAPKPTAAAAGRSTPLGMRCTQSPRRRLRQHRATR